MEKMKLFTKSFTDEKNAVYQLEYALLIRSADGGKVYGIGIKKTDAAGNSESDQAEGLFENREEAEQFICRLAEGLALPVELAALCDDFISEREMEMDQTDVQAAS